MPSEKEILFEKRQKAMSPEDAANAKAGRDEYDRFAQRQKAMIDSGRPLDAANAAIGRYGNVDAMDADLAAQQEASIGQAAPEAVEPLAPNRLSTLAQTLVKTAEALTGGQIPIPDPPQFGEAMEKIPDQLFAQLAALTGIAESVPEGESYRVNLEELVKDNNGLAELIGIIGKMGRDKALLKASMSAPKTEEKPKADDQAKADLGRFIPEDKPGFTGPSTQMGPTV